MSFYHQIIVIEYKMGVILLEGNIGCGKSTFLNKIVENNCMHNGMKIETIKEPVKEWTNSCEGNLLTSARNNNISPAMFQVAK